jgi:hypothetical protein
MADVLSRKVGVTTDSLISVHSIGFFFVPSVTELGASLNGSTSITSPCRYSTKKTTDLAWGQVLVNAVTGKVGTRTKMSGNPTNQAS